MSQSSFADLSHVAVELDPRIDLFAGSVAGTYTSECESFSSEAQKQASRPSLWASLSTPVSQDKQHRLIKLTLDTVKVRLQHPEVASRYRSVWHAFTTIIREERVRGLFRGISSPLVSCNPRDVVYRFSTREYSSLQRP